jgi:hypothetical protein
MSVSSDNSSATLPMPARRIRMAISQDRQDIYCQTLALTGSHAASAAAASPLQAAQRHCAGGAPGLEGFRDLRKRSPEFEARCKDAENAALARCERMAADRIGTPDTRPAINPKTGEVIPGGQAVSWHSANALLLRVLARLSPETWTDRKNVTGQLALSASHQHQRADQMILSLGNIENALTDSELTTFFAMLEKIQAAESGSKDEGEIIDAEVTMPALPEPPDVGVSQ